MNALPNALILPPRTLAGEGEAARLLSECRHFGRRGMLVHGRSLQNGGRLEAILRAAPDGMDVRAWLHAGGEPTVDQVDALRAAAAAFELEWVAAVGGGSVIDVAKAAAGLLRAPLPTVAYHDGAKLPESQTPFLAVPTTAGTGSEATIVSVLTNAATQVKKSFRHPSHMARLIILDGGLLDGCPGNVVAASGMDALCQAVESYVSRGSTRMTDEIARLAVELVAARLEAVFRGARGEPAQELLQGSYLAGVALSNARLGLVHGLAHPLGTRYHAGHGLVCGVCLPPVLEFNREVIGGKYDALSRTVGSDFLGFVTALLDRLGIQSPFRGNPLRDRDGIVRETLASGSTTANPRPVNEKDVTELLDRIFTGDSHEPETQSDLCAPQCSPVPGQAGGRQPDP